MDDQAIAIWIPNLHFTTMKPLPQGRDWQLQQQGFLEKPF
jgi:hypothetical protein